MSQKHLKYWIYAYTTLLLCPLKVTAQEFILGAPKIYNHKKENYDSGAQNWDVKSHKGHLYFANNGGLLSFDGIRWKTIGTPKTTVVRSLYVNSDESIYVGAQGELGFFRPNTSGVLEYTDLIPRISKSINNISDIWNITSIDQTLWFLTNNQVVSMTDTQINTYVEDAVITHMEKVGNDIWYHSSNKGLVRIQDGNANTISGSEIFRDFNVIDIVSKDEGNILVLTESNGIYTYSEKGFNALESNASKFLKEKKISSSFYSKKYGLCVGTILGGLIIINDAGQVTVHLDKKSGLQNNSVNCITQSPNGVLWLGTKNGIEEIDISSILRKFYPDNEIHGEVYDMDVWESHIFFSSSSGLYYIEKSDYYNPLQSNKFELVKGTEGQTWGTDIINDQLYIAHHTGAKMIDKTTFRSKDIPNTQSAWKFVKIANDMIAIGTYTGLKLFALKQNGDLEFYRDVKHFKESSRIMITDKYNNLWVSHPYRAVYRFNFNDDFSKNDFKEYNAQSGFKTNSKNYVFDVNDICYLTNETGIYKYNQTDDNFEVASALSKYFKPGNHVRRIIQNKNDIFCISDDFTSKLSLDDTAIESKIIKEEILPIETNSTYIGGFEELFALNDNTLILSSGDGALECNLSYKNNEAPGVSIKSISIPTKNDSFIYTGFNQLNRFELEPNENAISIQIGNEYVNSSAPLEYSMQLSNVDKGWSPWTKNKFKEYNNLRHGEYTFKIKSRNAIGIESEPVGFDFEVKTPWHHSLWAYLLYVLLGIGAILWMMNLQRQKYNQKTALLEAEKRKTEEEFEIIKREKLMNELSYRNKELANSTLHLLQKNQTIKTLKTKFDELNNNIKNPALKSELNKIISIFRNDLRVEEDWDKFSFYFDQVHSDFIKKLRKKFPQLTTNDHKLCAYLKMNLTTKEIAPLLNISVRGIEISRYRLRKKLGLERAVNLNEFFNDEFE